MSPTSRWQWHIFLTAERLSLTWTRPWGAGYLARQAGVFPTRSVKIWASESIDFVKRALQTLLLAAIASSLPLEELDIRSSYLKDDDCISPDMLVLPALSADQSHLTTLTRLTLIVNPNNHAQKFWI